MRKELLSRWIADRKDDLNIKFICHHVLREGCELLPVLRKAKQFLGSKKFLEDILDALSKEEDGTELRLDTAEERSLAGILLHSWKTVPETKMAVFKKTKDKQNGTKPPKGQRGPICEGSDGKLHFQTFCWCTETLPDRSMY